MAIGKEVVDPATAERLVAEALRARPMIRLMLGQEQIVTTVGHLFWVSGDIGG